MIAYNTCFVCLFASALPRGLGADSGLGEVYVVRQPGRKTRAHSNDDHDVASKAIEETIFVVAYVKIQANVFI
jgi:hypothetical protein